MSAKRSLDGSHLAPSPKRRRTTGSEWWNQGIEDDEDEECLKGRQLDYFAGIDYKLSNEAFEDATSETLFIDRVIEEIEQQPSCFVFEHPSTSRVVEKVLELSSPDQVGRVCSVMMPNVCALVQSKCASHVIQTALALIAKMLGNEPKDGPLTRLLSELIDKLTAFGLCRLFVSPQSTFVVRDLLWITAGVVRVDSASKRRRLALHNVRNLSKSSALIRRAKFDGFARTVAASVLESGLEIFGRILCDGDDRQKSVNRIMCSSVGVLLQCLKLGGDGSAETLQKVIDVILSPPPPKGQRQRGRKGKGNGKEVDHVIDAVFKSSHLMQCVFECGDKAIALRVVKEQLNEEQIRKMAFDGEANFVLQSVLRRLDDVWSIELIAGVVDQAVAGLIEMNRIGVLVETLEALGRAHLTPSSIITAIVECIGAESQFGSGTVIQLFLRLKTSTKALRTKELQSKLLWNASRFSVTGCLLLSAIVRSKSPSSRSLCGEFLVLSLDEAVEMSRDSTGSTVIESFMHSEHVAVDRKWKLVQMMACKLALLCTDRFGSRVVEAAFSALGHRHKLEMAALLLRKERVLRGSRLGLIVFHKLHLDILQRDKAEWSRIISGHREDVKSDAPPKKHAKTANQSRARLRHSAKSKQRSKATAKVAKRGRKKRKKLF